MEKGFFHPSLGYWQTNTDPSEAIRAAYPDGTIEVELQPSPLHKMANGKWIAPTQDEFDAAAAAAVKMKREAILGREVDPVATNALRWAAMTDAQRQAWADYRQALLDITKQAGFPHNVTWPAKPE